jgi:anti-sigma regulatory factor (Ser/Thr protein kinase)
MLSLPLPRDRRCAALARDWLEDHLAGASGELLDDLKLITTELVINAFLHGRGQIELRVTRLPHRIRIEVIDEGRGAAIRIRDSDMSSGGWGLKLVDQISTAWGAYEGATHVWADVASHAATGSAGERSKSSAS